MNLITFMSKHIRLKQLFGGSVTLITSTYTHILIPPLQLRASLKESHTYLRHSRRSTVDHESQEQLFGILPPGPLRTTQHTGIPRDFDRRPDIAQSNPPENSQGPTYQTYV